MRLLDSRLFYKPFYYDWAFEAHQLQGKIHWIPEEVNFADDVFDWNHKLSSSEKNLLTQIFRFFVQGDIQIATAYLDVYIPIFKHPEIRMMLSTFAAQEAIHVEGYARLIDTLHLPEVEYQAFMEYDEMRSKHEYLEQFDPKVLKGGNEKDYHKSIAKSLAVFSGFSEGVQLFSSFAILLNFSRFGKMRGMNEIVSWSLKDECCDSETEVLTDSGWIKFPELNDSHKVAAFNIDDETIIFEKPKRIINTPYEGLMYHYAGKENNKINQLVSPNHRILYKQSGKYQFKEARSYKPNHHHQTLPVAGKATGNKVLSFYERFLIALQADGTLPELNNKNRNGADSGFIPVTFKLKRERKIKRLEALLLKLNFSYTKSLCPDGASKYYVKVPMHLVRTKKFKDWVSLDNLSLSYCRDFIEEIMEWDGSDVHKDGSVVYYSSTIEDNTDVVQSIATLANYVTTKSVQHDNRKETYNNVYRLWIKKRTNQIIFKDNSVQEVNYNGTIHCVEVSTGAFVTRREGCVSVTGNSLHVESMIKLFNTFVDEYPHIWTNYFKRDIYSIAERMVDLENKFIDLCFKEGGVEGLTPEDVKGYVKYITDRRLLQMRLKPIFKQKTNPCDWLTYLLNAPSHTNFFEARETNYSKGGLTGNWNDAFKNLFKK